MIETTKKAQIAKNKAWMEILIFGAGAIGGVFGGFLSKQHGVDLLGRPRHLEAIRRAGLHIKGIWKKHLFKKFGLYCSVEDIIAEGRSYDLILLTTQSFDTERAARDIRRIIDDRTIVMSLQNGLGNVETLQQHLPRQQVMAGRVIFGVEITPGCATVTVSADDVVVGEVAKQAVSRRARTVARLFTEAGIASRATADIRRYIWAKVIYNCALNALATIFEFTYGDLLLTDETKRLMQSIVEEIYLVAEKAGIRLSPVGAEGYIRLLFGKLIPLTSAHHPSMLQRINMGKHSEIDALNGAIARMADQYKVAAPINHMLAQLIRAKEKYRMKTSG